MTSPRSLLPARWARWLGSLEFVAGSGLCAALAVALVLKRWLQTHDPVRGDIMQRLGGIGVNGHWLGTDNLGRDLWSRMLEGLGWSVSAALTATAIALSIGLIAGLLAAERPGWTRTMVNHFVNIGLSMPGLVIAMIVVAILGRGFWPLTLTLGILTWPVFARVVYGEARKYLEMDYVLAARLVGSRPLRILLTHVLPALRPTLLVLIAFHFADMMILESALSFLGLGAPLGVPTWGNMLQEARDFLLIAPWLLAVPAAGIVIVVIAANLLGDGIAERSRQQGRGIDM
jgi:peptide/nickel transport system permease protein